MKNGKHNRIKFQINLVKIKNGRTSIIRQGIKLYNRKWIILQNNLEENKTINKLLLNQMDFFKFSSNLIED